MYIPKPINTDDVILPEDIISLGEKIAENTHEVWSENRMKDGWTYGEKRDDDKKHHPCLIPYSELSEEEKAYDRSTSFETLKLIVKLGYKITKE
jgi:ryanodine receptor 2